MSTFCQRSYHRKCQRRGIGGQKSFQRSLWTTPKKKKKQKNTFQRLSVAFVRVLLRRHQVYFSTFLEWFPPLNFYLLPIVYNSIYQALLVYFFLAFKKGYIIVVDIFWGNSECNMTNPESKNPDLFSSNFAVCFDFFKTEQILRIKKCLYVTVYCASIFIFFKIN